MEIDKGEYIKLYSQAQDARLARSLMKVIGESVPLIDSIEVHQQLMVAGTRAAIAIEDEWSEQDGKLMQDLLRNYSLLRDGFKLMKGVLDESRSDGDGAEDREVSPK